VLALDSSAIIHYFKGAGRVVERLQSTAPYELAIPAVVLYELDVGVARLDNPKRRREALNLLARAVRILAFDEAAAKAAATIRTELERQGRGIGPMDTLIAGTALANSATLVTHNTREFARVRGLRLVDWY
jgi:tRNA(fMet)-specific endonuclease VapC